MKTLSQNTKAVGSSAYWGNGGDWFIAAAMTRDSEALVRSNFICFERALKALPEFKAWEGDDAPVTIERFSHWACGWVDYLVIDPAFAAGVALAESLREKLEDYPVLDEDHYSQEEQDEAESVWANCYNERKRVKYIRENRDQFEFRSFSDLLGCVRGRYFAGYASELIR